MDCRFILLGNFLPDPGIELESPALEGGFFMTEPPGKPRSLSAVTGTQFKTAVATREQTLDAGHRDLKPEQHGCA